MAEEIPDIQMSQIIERMCKKSDAFKNFYTSEVPKFKGKPIRWKFDPNLPVEGLAIRPCGGTSEKYEIILKRHPTELMRTDNYFLISHEIEHHVQREEDYPAIILHDNILRLLTPEHKKISALLKSMLFDFSVNVKLKTYGIEIPFTCLKPPKEDKSQAYNITYILRYVIFRRNSLLMAERYEKEIQECLEKYTDKHLVNIGNKIFEIINCSKFVDSKGNMNLNQIIPVIEEIFANLKEFFLLPYKFKLTIKQCDCSISIAPTEIF